VRHGQSQATVDQVVGGEVGCTGLSDLGRRQAQALAARLAASGLLADTSVLYASVLPRAVETAEIIRPSVGSGDLEVNEDCDLCEVHPGEADGLLWSEFSERYGSPPWESDPSVPLSPGGESLLDFRGRVAGALGRLADAHPGETVVVACHGGVIVESMIALGGLPAAGERARLEPDNTGLTIFLRRSDGWVLDRYNDVAHLDGLT
jgi:probable phosphoglycerate mutase